MRPPLLSLVLCVTSISLLVACKREDRLLRHPPSGAYTLNSVQVSGLNPGAYPARLHRPQTCMKRAPTLFPKVRNYSTNTTALDAMPMGEAAWDRPSWMTTGYMAVNLEISSPR